MVVALGLMTTISQAATVCSEGCDFTSIQAAIDAASPGDTISVRSGIYYEHLDVNKAVKLIGINSGDGMPVIDAGGYGSAVTVNANDAEIKGFNVTNSGHCGCGNSGISIQANNSIITENRVFKNKYGIRCIGDGNAIWANDLIENDISTYNEGNNTWDESPSPLGFLGFKGKGNYYTDFDQESEGCVDQNKDGICDEPRNVTEGQVDNYPLAKPTRM